MSQQATGQGLMGKNYNLFDISHLSRSWLGAHTGLSIGISSRANFQMLMGVLIWKQAGLRKALVLYTKST